MSAKQPPFPSVEDARRALDSGDDIPGFRTYRTKSGAVACSRVTPEDPHPDVDRRLAWPSRKVTHDR